MNNKKNNNPIEAPKVNAFTFANYLGISSFSLYNLSNYYS